MAARKSRQHFSYLISLWFIAALKSRQHFLYIIFLVQLNAALKSRQQKILNMAAELMAAPFRSGYITVVPAFFLLLLLVAVVAI